MLINGLVVRNSQHQSVMTVFGDTKATLFEGNLVCEGTVSAANLSYNPWWVAGKVDGTTLTILKIKAGILSRSQDLLVMLLVCLTLNGSGILTRMEVII